ncbi:MAG: hypothetical protein J7J14_03100 [Thermotogaceae bacterium]|nr:hypothetical protein [Thermotogaceae bacterium]RKX54324.1 MAG: hypothetical protein DRP24_06360 [Thermotoga sp.]HDG61548.1 hypothetical protein [Thermotoga sp.]
MSMVRPVDLQTVFVRGVDVANQANFQINQQLVAQQIASHETVQQAYQQERSVNPNQAAEEKSVRTSTEKGGRNPYLAYRRKGERKGRYVEIEEDKKGLLVDVRL